MSEVSSVPLALGLSKQVRNYYKLRSERARSYGFHPSEVSGEEFCPVQAYFLEEAYDKLTSHDGNTVKEGYNFIRTLLRAKANSFRPGLYSEFVIGDAIHELLQYELGVIGKLWGVWECPSCNRTTKEAGWMPRTKVEDRYGKEMLDAAPCNHCQGQNYRYRLPWRYVEPSVGWTATAQALGLKGHMDGDLYDYRDGQWFRYVLEIKSINDYGWNEGKNPKWQDIALYDGWTPPSNYVPARANAKKALPIAKHVSQASLYAAANGITHICFVYVNKNQVSKRKEIIVPLDEMTLELARNKIEAVTLARKLNTGPPVHARVCQDPRDEQARNCPAAERCFGRLAPKNSFGG